jgi:hypothetical protein
MSIPMRVTGPSRRRRIFASAVAVVWCLALVPGIWYLLAFETTPGLQSSPASAWPAHFVTDQDPRLPTLVVALHPRCACSQATLAQLEEAAKHFEHAYNAILLIDVPRGADYQWREVSFYREAQKALHAKVILDEDGRLAASFGALTSGEVFFYSAADKLAKRSLLFAGGVTGSRGMIGPNKGIAALMTAFQQNSHTEGAHPPVFGCALFIPHRGQDRSIAR